MKKLKLNNNKKKKLSNNEYRQMIKEAYDRCMSIIASCENTRQILSARKYCYLYRDKLLRIIPKGEKGDGLYKDVWNLFRNAEFESDIYFKVLLKKNKF